MTKLMNSILINHILINVSILWFLNIIVKFKIAVNFWFCILNFIH